MSMYLLRRFPRWRNKRNLPGEITRSVHRETAPSSNRHFTEVEIDVPWGKIAGKLWGMPDRQPVLAVHGWQDNAGSFDALAPLLLEHSSILAIDLPGHGLSSWLPPGGVYSDSKYVILLQRLKNHFGWEKMKLLAHSLGAQISFWYASVFPENVEFVVALDYAQLTVDSATRYNRMFADGISKLLRLETFRTAPPSYPVEELLRRYITATDGSVNEDACRTLMVRGARKNTDGTFSFSRDPRLKVLPMNTMFDLAHVRQSASRIVCPYMVVSADDGMTLRNRDHFAEVAGVLKDSSRDFVHVALPGTHHVHLVDPIPVAKAIVPFLKKYN